MRGVKRRGRNSGGGEGASRPVYVYICVCVCICVHGIPGLRFVRGQASNIASLRARNSAGGKQGGWNSFVGSKNVAAASKAWILSVEKRSVL